MAKMKSSVIFTLIGIAIVLVALAYLFTLEQKTESLAPETVVEQEDVVTEEPLDGDNGQQQAEAEIVDIDVEAALSERVLGNPNAPVKISEHSSFTCGHCGKFHQQTFKAFKTAWIDTSKAYLVFSDFPLNAPALHASMVARCLPEENYFNFVQMLFETQSQWAYDVGYMNYLKTKAAENGLSAEGFKACLNSQELQEGILDRVRAAQAQWEISSTPSFVVNNTEVISGALSYADFNAALESAVNPGVASEMQNEEESSQPEDLGALEDGTGENSSESSSTEDSAE